jgi:starvation-inducible DNA-binding protein
MPSWVHFITKQFYMYYYLSFFYYLVMAQKATLVPQLTELLSDTFLLYVKTLNFHWNVVAPTFQMLHQLFQTQYEELAEAADTLAEQIRILGATPPHSLRQFLDHSSLVEAEGVRSAPQMLEELASDHETIIARLRPAIQAAQKNNDEGTADLLIDRLRVHEKTLWMLRSHR